MHIESFWVEGYRSFAERIRITDLGQVVTFFGVNNAGKSNLLRVIELLGRLMKLPLNDLSAQYGFSIERTNDLLGEDISLFSLGKERVALGACFRPSPGRWDSPGLPQKVEVEFEIVRQSGRIAIQLKAWRDEGHSQLAPLLSWWEATSTGEDLSSQQGAEFNDLLERWKRLGQACAATSPTVALFPLSAERRAQLVRLGQSREAKARASYRQILDSFESLEQGLPRGKLAPLENPPEYPQDFCWETDDGLIPLNQLGTGSQAILALIAALMMAESPIVLLEEPESHLNGLLQEKVAAALQEIARKLDCQVIMATHAPTFARKGVDIRHVERHADGSTQLQKLDEPSPLHVYQPSLPASAPNGSSLPLLDHDRRVRVPDFALEHSGVKPGQWLHFLSEGDKIWLLNSAQHDALFSEEP